MLLAFLTTRFRTVNEGLTPLAVAVNATPIVALAPIFNAWFGITGTLSNQAVVVAVVFFPVFINTAKGLTEVHPDEIELMRSYAAGEWMILREVRIPNALPFFANALRLVAPLSVIAAIVAEYFGGPQARITTSSRPMRASPATTPPGPPSPLRRRWALHSSLRHCSSNV